MKTKYYWDPAPIVGCSIVIAISPLLVILITRNWWYTENLLPIILVSVLAFYLDCMIFVFSIFDALKETTTFGKDNVHVRRPRYGSFKVSVKKIKRICISMQYFDGLSGRNARLAISVNEIDGKIIGVGARMLTAILAIYPHIKVAVLYSGRHLGKKNAILLAQRGYLKEQQLQEVQKRYKLPDGFEKHE